VDIIGRCDLPRCVAATRGIDVVFYLVPGNDPDSFDFEASNREGAGIAAPRSRTGCSASSC
jgi:hypothetical protein